MSTHELKFWQQKSLAEMTRDEWESVCDGCGRCCMQKLQSQHDNSVMYTRVACQLLDTESCRCSDYPNRKKKVPECIQLNSQNLAEFDWLPGSCAYQRLHSGKGLSDWHPLVSGSDESVHEAGISMRGQCVSESWVHVDEFSRLVVDFDAMDDGLLTD